MVFAEALTEYLIDGLGEALAKVETPAPPIPLAVDRYIAMSALQKAIRRGDENLALRAAMTVRRSRARSRAGRKSPSRISALPTSTWSAGPRW